MLPGPTPVVVTCLPGPPSGGAAGRAAQAWAVEGTERVPTMADAARDQGLAG